jgi:membrane protease YdiL (CAAX protease family)
MQTVVFFSTWRRVVIGLGAGVVAGAVLSGVLFLAGAVDFTLTGIPVANVLEHALPLACEALVPWLLLWVFVVPALLRIPFGQPWLALIVYAALAAGMRVVSTPALADSWFAIVALVFLALLLGLPIVRGHGAWMSSGFVIGSYFALVSVAGFPGGTGIGVFAATLSGEPAFTGGTFGPLFGLPGLIVTLWLTVQIIRHQQLLFVRAEASRGSRVKSLNELVIGFTAAAMAASLVFAAFLFAEQSRIALFKPTLEALSASISGAGLPYVLADELLYRYVLVALVLLVARRGWIAAILAAAIVTGLHLLEPGATPWTATSAALAALAGGLAYVWTGKLWMPIAIGFGWFVCMGPIFGFSSGGPVPRGSWFVQEVLEYTKWSGGVHGPEGSAFAIAARVLLVAAVWWTVGQGKTKAAA